jgi:hypothetical protein
MLLVFCGALVVSCYYDNAEDLYKNFPKGCDTTSISYQLDVRPIIDANCIACHGAIAPSAGLDLTTYDKLKANSTKVKTRINLPANDPLVMPQGAPMNQCNISIVTKWIDQGSPNN